MDVITTLFQKSKHVSTSKLKMKKKRNFHLFLLFFHFINRVFRFWFSLIQIIYLFIYLILDVHFPIRLEDAATRELVLSGAAVAEFFARQEF